MASQEGFVVENKFINGLITQSTALNFPVDACTDTNNCVFDEQGKVTRRLGFDIESGGVVNATTTSTVYWTEYVWYTSAATSSKAFLVQQQGPILYFFDITNNTTPSTTVFYTVNINAYIPSGSSLNSYLYPCQYATGNGDLIVTNFATNPIYFTYSDTANTITPTAITLQHRDTLGLHDEYYPLVNFRPTESVATLKTNGPSHYYNLINQGWYAGTALADWDTDVTTMPSNADAVAYTRGAVDDIYKTAGAANNNPGNSPAPKGHFILNVGEDDRTTAALNEGFTGFTLPATATSTQFIDASSGTIIGDFTATTSNAFDGLKAVSSPTATKTSATSAYIGKNITAISGRKISRVVVWPSSSGFVSGTGNITIELYGKTTAPASATDGTLLGTTGSIADTIYGQVINSSNTSTTYNYVWVRIVPAAGSVTYQITELEIYSAGAPGTRARCCAFFAGRAFYAGVDGTDTGSTIYFSQVTVEKDRYGACYQINDPTSEKFADLLATDGGTIKIPEMGYVQKLFPFQNSLLVFATNGVWQIGGNGNDGFAATGYKVRRLSNIGMTSPLSVVDVKGVPMWLGEDGFYTINYDPNYDSAAVKSLTEETIKSTVLAIDPYNRQFVRAAFDRQNNFVYFGYRSIPTIVPTELQEIDSMLVFNAKTSAWFKWSWTVPYSTALKIVGMSFIQDGQRQLPGVMKYAAYMQRSSDIVMTYLDFSTTTYTDFTTLDTFRNNGSTFVSDYSSYVIAGYRIDGQAMRNFTTKYLWTFMNDKANSSLMVQGIWDFTSSSSSGKWSTPQQAYNSLTTKGRTYYNLRVSRRVIRGCGKALQLKYYSVTGKPFELVGWGMYETGNDAA